MNCVVDNAWSLPPVLEHDRNEELELLYVRVPFAAEIETREGPDVHRELRDRLAQTLVGALGLSGRGYGVRHWPADDLIAWRTRGSDNVRVDEIQQLLIDASRPFLDEVDRADDLQIAAVALEFAGADRISAFARAIDTARQAADDPHAYELECATTLLDLALRNRAFTFRHQPIVDIASREVFAYESLCRGTVAGMRFPDLIFSVAKHADRVGDVGQVLRDLLAARLDAHQLPPTLQFINVHPDELSASNFVEHVTQGPLAKHAHSIVLELTEHARAADYAQINEVLVEVRRHGYRLAVDDLGSGAGLNDLAELHPDFVKFDMSLVRDIDQHPIKRRLLSRIQQFATEIGARTIAEGIETPQERDAMFDTGCTLMQGYFFARPGRGFASVDDESFGTAAWFLEAERTLATA